ncbi:stage II sporulation protein M [Natronococcus pandeyae]|uniref:Stage II sporulation protein M n=1 Tax=Natronococcus pandeyae TaxID=2055836 RepID=A0A8J8TQI8_9EURY|nr:stage II sporulation protein M [Natronococcus pandeyae]TYL38513.1 stage II sporulation protein M [Natronococcus pandeyae]
MTLSASISAAVAVLRQRPSDLLPFYLLGAAVPAIVRLIPFLGLFLGYLYLELTGRLELLRAEFEAGTLDPPDPEAEPDAFDAWAEGLVPLLEQLITFELGLLVLVTIAATVVSGIGLFAVISAGQLAACYGRLRDDRGLLVGLAGARRFWLRFAGLYVLEFVLWILVFGLIAIGVALFGAVLTAVTGTGLATILVGLPAVFLAGLLVVVIRAVFAFAPVAIVVDDASVFDSVSRAAGFIRRQPIGAAFYYVIAVGSLVALSVVTGVLAMVDVLSVGTLVTTLVLFPFLDLLKTALYGDSRGRLSPPSVPERSLRHQFTGGLRRGWREMLSFVRATPLLHAFVVVAAVASFWAGWEVAEPLAGTVETSIAARLEGHIPPAAALEFFGNNWMVAYTTAYAGLALAIPAFVSLAFNGFVMGIYARLEVELVELAAFVVPHGIIEVPAIFIASALGLWLGLVGWRSIRGRATPRDLADALERAFWVVVGLGILLAVAAFIEGFVSPYYYGLFL